MSKVKIEGHSSGSGTLTLQAPDTDSARTITLPDATGTLLNSDGDGSSLTGVGVDGISSSADATAITITSNEKVGIGETSPGEILSLKANFNGCRISFEDTQVGASKFIVGHDTNRFIFYDHTNSAHRLSLMDDGRGLSEFTAKAWCNFNGTGTPAFRDSHNCSTISDNGTGNYTINFTNNLANANYSVSGTVSANSGNGAAHGLETTKTSHSTSGIGVLTWYTDHTLYDDEYVNVLVFGD